MVERDWNETCDVRALKEDTTSPYLIGPNGYYMRDPATRKPLIGDLSDGTIKAWDEDIGDAALDRVGDAPRRSDDLPHR